MKNFVEIYHIFKRDSGIIWKIEKMYVPEGDVVDWESRKGCFVEKSDLEAIGIKIL